jgi:16S rRNA (uracil1498-N3)-methyltransferase
LGATVSIEQKMKNKNMPKQEIFLCLALLKKDNFELAVQKAVELGISHIVPLLCERSEKKNMRADRLERIIIEAVEQSGRGDVPTLSEIITLADALESDALPKEKIVLHPDGEYVGDALSKIHSQALAVFIGPEGGFSDAEIKEFALHSIPTVSLGPQILRAETAAVAIASLLLL